ncbi:MAG: LuxR C-terminal-related transcriptional regulator [Bacteroidetes bacterium]|nr:LuxR C-terminal-related transcriptional regulator [Bacteroidota bacterium]
MSLLCVLSFSGFAQEIPNIISYNPESYKAETQNWDITQDARGYIYVANNYGLLAFNGIDWQTYPTPNQTIMRSVKAVGNLIYTGYYMEFGYWETDAYGKLTYNNLSDAVRQNIVEDEQFWKIHAFKDLVIFQSLNQIFIYNTTNKEFKIIKAAGIIEKSVLVNGGLFYHTTEGQIFNIENGISKYVVTVPLEGDDRIENIFYVDNEWLILTKKSGFYTYSAQGLIKKSVPADALLSQTTIYTSHLLSTGNIALGLIANGFLMLDKQGNVVETFSNQKGLSNNTVLSIFEDQRSNIWLGLDIGINVINYESKIKLFQDIDGFLGTVYSSKIFKNKLYLGTNQGLYWRTLDSNDSFKLIQNTKGQVWELFEFDDHLLCAHNFGIYSITDDKADLVFSDDGVWTFQKIPNQEDKILLGMYKGLGILSRSQDGWGFNKLEGFDISSRSLVIDASYNIWVNHEYKGIHQLKVDIDFTSVEETPNNFSNRPQKNSSIIKFRDKIVYADISGLYVYDYHTKAFEKDETKSQMTDSTAYLSGKLSNIDNQELWLFNKNNIAIGRKNLLTGSMDVSKVILPQHKRKTMVGYENVTKLSEGKYLIGNTTGYIILQTDQTEIPDFQLYLNGISHINKKDVSTQHPVNESFQVPYDFRELRFEFSTQNLDITNPTLYQYKLSGFDEHWSDWSQESKVGFIFLDWGNYTLQVRAKRADKLSSNTIAINFEVRKPWYWSSKMILLYALLTIFVVYLIHITYRRYYHKKQRHLLTEQQKQVEELERINQEQIIRLKNDQLNLLIEKKNQELESTTSNLIQKNELLNNIKKEIKKVKNQNEVKSLLDFIENNRDESSDWKLFEDAFNKADKEFLNRLKEKHQALTNNDLRLCAYLRLNLSSKEIAPLLNISIRSVEIKRYRLRQKLGLTHDENLTDYILSF